MALLILNHSTVSEPKNHYFPIRRIEVPSSHALPALLAYTWLSTVLILDHNLIDDACHPPILHIYHNNGKYLTFFKQVCLSYSKATDTAC